MRKPKTKAGKEAKMDKTMGEFKRKELRSGSGAKVKDRKQAIAIGLKQSSQSRDSKKRREKRLEGKAM
jgi:hypothetical protein